MGNDRKDWIADSEKRHGKLDGLVIISLYDIENMMVGAIEGGSNYWYLLGDLSEVKKLTPELKGEPIVTRILKAVVTHGATVEIYDAENEKDLLGVISKENLLRAEKLLMTDTYKYNLGNILHENDDAGDADVFFQLVVMGKVVYG